MPSVGPGDAYLRIRLVDGAAKVDGATHVDLGHHVSGDEDGGSWVRWDWDGASLTVRNDRFAAYPVFYAVPDGSIAISPSVDRLLSMGIPADLDADALAVFLTVGYYVGDDTPFRAIRALPPAATLVWHDGQVRLSTSRMKLPLASMSRAEAVDGLIERVRAAVGRRLGPAETPFIMPISGGRDSRHLLLELLRQGRTPTSCITVRQYPTDWGGDAPYAAQLCEVLGIPHRVVEPGPLIAAEMRKNRFCSYGADEHAWLLPLADALVGNTEYTYDGLGGGLLLHRDFMTGSIRRLQDAGRWDELAASLGKKDGRRARFESLLAPTVGARITAERAAARIREELEQHLGADDPYLSFTIWNRTIREVALASGAMLAGVPAVFTPFLDREFFAFAASIPGEMAGTRLHDEVISTAFPEVADVPYVPPRRPRPGRSFMRKVNRDLLRLLVRPTEQSLVDRRALIGRAALGSLRGDGWFAWGRRAALTTYLMQIEGLVGAPGGTPEATLSKPVGWGGRSRSKRRRII